MEFQNNVLLRPESLTPGTPPDRRRLNGITILCDLTGLGIHNLTPSVYKIVQMIAKIDQDNYPENLAKMYIINAPVMFNMVWKVVRKFLERETKQKIMVFSGPDQVRCPRFFFRAQIRPCCSRRTARPTHPVND